MNNEVQIAIIGIIGTLAGTFLGWLLNNLSKKGKLIISLNKWIDIFEYNNTGFMVESSSKEQTEYYGYKTSIDIYNSSDEVKIMRCLSIQFRNGKTILKENVPLDVNTRRTSQKLTIYDDVSVINIPAKTVVNIDLKNGFWKNSEGIDFIWETDNIFLSYKNEKNKEIFVRIKNEEYKKFFI